SRYLSDYRRLLDLHSFPTRRSSDLDDVHADGSGLQVVVQREEELAAYRFRHRLCRARIESDTTPRAGSVFFPTQPPVRLTFGRRSEEHTSELQSRENLVCRLLLEKK